GGEELVTEGVWFEGEGSVGEVFWIGGVVFATEGGGLPGPEACCGWGQLAATITAAARIPAPANKKNNTRMTVAGTVQGVAGTGSGKVGVGSTGMASGWRGGRPESVIGTGGARTVLFLSRKGTCRRCPHFGQEVLWPPLLMGHWNTVL